MSKTKERIRDSQLRYKQGLGQNFIYDEDLLYALVASSGVTKEDDVLEVGPGSGSMTKYLCDAARTVTSIELDDRLIPLLNTFLADKKNFTLVHGDVMKTDLNAVTKDMRKPLSVVANIPYYITTPLITHLLTCGLPIRRMALMVQKEVADKIMCDPGDEQWGMLALRCQYMAEAHLAMDVPAACFTPVPKVDSAFIVLTMRDTPAVHPVCEDDFFRVAAAGFALRRKTMLNALCATLRLEKEAAAGLLTEAGLDLKIRGEKLTLEELCRLSDCYTHLKQNTEDA